MGEARNGFIAYPRDLPVLGGLSAQQRGIVVDILCDFNYRESYIFIAWVNMNVAPGEAIFSTVKKAEKLKVTEKAIRGAIEKMIKRGLWEKDRANKKITKLKLKPEYLNIVCYDGANGRATSEPYNQKENKNYSSVLNTFPNTGNHPDVAARLAQLARKEAKAATTAEEGQFKTND